MLRRGVLILLLFIVLIFGGCSTPEPTLKDELNEIDSDLQWVMSDLDFVIEQLEQVEEELNIAGEADWECGGLDELTFIAWSEGEQINYLRRQLLEIWDEIGDAQNRLYDIRPK